jgi:hypothetical protein
VVVFVIIIILETTCPKIRPCTLTLLANSVPGFLQPLFKKFRIASVIIARALPFQSLQVKLFIQCTVKHCG